MTDVSRETEELFGAYHELVKLWNPKINLVAPSTLDDFRQRHINDSLQIADIAHQPSGTWTDIGSGGGLPGLIMAINFRNKPISFKFIESDKRKCQFLRTVSRELQLENVSVISERIEQVPPIGADFVSARALAPLPLLLNYVHRHLSPSGVAYLMKGKSWRDEVGTARDDWQFDVEDFTSKTDPEAAILKISGVSHA